MLRRIPLGKMNNLRDLGGYPAGDGVTVWERFLRGDNPAGLSEQDIQWLRERDITTIVDLRSGEELARQPDQLRGQPGFLYHHCPLVGIEKLPNLEADIGRAYFEAMDRLTCVGRAMRILAAAPGGVLFHCTAGKDRTGILAMLLLSLAGVAREDILADYQISETYLAEIIQLIQLRVPDLGGLRRPVQAGVSGGVHGPSAGQVRLCAGLPPGGRADRWRTGDPAAQAAGLSNERGSSLVFLFQFYTEYGLERTDRPADAGSGSPAVPHHPRDLSRSGRLCAG